MSGPDDMDEERPPLPEQGGGHFSPYGGKMSAGFFGKIPRPGFDRQDYVSFDLADWIGGKKINLGTLEGTGEARAGTTPGPTPTAKVPSPFYKINLYPPTDLSEGPDLIQAQVRRFSMSALGLQLVADAMVRLAGPPA